MSDSTNTDKKSSTNDVRPVEGSPLYWQSLEELKGWSPSQEEYLAPFDAEKGGVLRRDFLKLMGASLALAGSACVRRPVQKIVPYIKRPEEVIPGVANYYASTWVDGGEGFGLVVKTYSGRPVKLEGNELHPVNQGKLSARAHGHILNLYDPDRIQGPKKVAASSAADIGWDELDGMVSAQLSKGKVAILSSSLASPTTYSLIEKFLDQFQGELFLWDVLGADDIIEGQKASYGQALLPQFRFDRAQLVVSIDTDFLGTVISPVEFSRQFASTRSPGKEFSKLVAFESNLSLTGANADQRFRIRPSDQVLVVMGLLYEIIVKGKNSRFVGDSRITSLLEGYKGVAGKLGIKEEEFSELANSLWEHRGRSLIASGGLSTRSGNLSLQVATNFLNSVLENEGVTVDTRNSIESYQGSYKHISNLIQKMKSGQISTLIIHNCNPIYALATDSGFVEALKNVKLVVFTGDRVDETGQVAHLVAPDHHPMENWGDAELRRGVFSIQQPTIRPLYKTRAFQDSLMVWAKGSGKALSREENWHDYLKSYWKERIYAKYGGEGLGAGSFETFWNSVLQKGVYDVSLRESHGQSGQVRSFNTNSLSLIEKSKSVNGYELVLYSKMGVGDGKLANVSWLQELPDPITKIVWDNYVNISPKSARKEGLSEGDLVQLKSGSQSVELPVHIQPGLHDEVLAVAIGYGRTGAGQIGNNIGKNAFLLSRFQGGSPQFSGLEAQISKTGKTHKLVNTQGHHRMEGRAIVVEATNAQYQEKPDAGIHHHKIFSIWPGHKYPGHKWAMAIDMTKCTGCSACVVACQSENNIQIVGKDRIANGREMQWMKIDRYYKGDEENPTSVFQPMLCQHCDHAPCEAVCPVVATSHSNEGLNEMTYNRCVGTRYCANNCPYKARRFNWFEYSNINYPLTMALNPAVTTRSRGVMEKCTFCVQRIKEGKNAARDKDAPLNDGDIVTACQQTCPAEAIVFGDVNDPKSRISQLYKDSRSYKVLDEFNAEPAIRYLTKIRNVDHIQGDANEEGHA